MSIDIDLQPPGEQALAGVARRTRLMYCRCGILSLILEVVRT